MQIWYRRILWLLIAYIVQRVLFFGFNFHALQSTPLSILLLSSLDGLRFDLCVIATINLPLIALHIVRNFQMLERSRRWMDHLVGMLFLASNIPLIVFGIVDSRLFAFTGHRISPDIFAIGGDIQGQSLGILIQYWYVTIPGLMAIAAFSWATWQSNHDIEILNRHRLRDLSPFAVITILIGGLLIRGGWQTKPLAPTHAYNWQPAALANFVLNSGMTVLRTPSTTHVKRLTDFKSIRQIREILSPINPEINTIPLANGKNIVVIVVESLAAEYVGYLNKGLNNGKGYTPFLDDLATRSITFNRSFANGRRSIDAMPAIFAGIPAWREQAFITSQYASNDIRPAPKVLSPLGYKSMFLHGAANGSMHFDVFAKMAGFDEYIGKNEYPHKGDDDGQWGIFDEPFLAFAVEKFSATKQPFFAGIFTLTSHNPFKIPDQYTGRFPKGTLPIHESIGYVDYALSQFFKKAASESWFYNTIFVITGDHTSLSDNPDYNNMPGRFMVPILFYDPTGSLPRIESTKIATHIDITPTILELVGARVAPAGMFGGPLFDRSWTGRYVQQEYDTWYFTDGSAQIRMTGTDDALYYPPDDLTWQHAVRATEIPDSTKKLLQLKASRQYYNNGLLDNNWYKE